MSSDPGSGTDPGKAKSKGKRLASGNPDPTVLGYAPSERPAEPSPLPEVPTHPAQVRQPSDSFDEIFALAPDHRHPPSDPVLDAALYRKRLTVDNLPIYEAPKAGFQSDTGVGDEGPATGIWQYAEPDMVPDGESSHIIGGRYRIVRGIALGGMGAVFEVRHLRLDRPFAMKLIHADQAADPRLMKFFLREARVLSRLRHPGIVEVTDFGSDPHHGFFLVMELLEGETLEARLKRDGEMPVGQALVMALQVAEALRYMHLQDLVHCDVKPGNVYLCREDEIAGRRRQAKLVDFGLSRPRAKGAQLAPSEVAGTPLFAAPEQITGSAPQVTMDVYSVGAMLWSMLTGEAPYRGSSLEVLSAKLDGPPPPPSTRASQRVGQRLDSLVSRCLESRRENRPATMNNLVYELRTLLDMQGEARPDRQSRRRPPTSKNRIPRPLPTERPGRSSVSLRDPCREITLPLFRLSLEGRLADCGYAVCHLLGEARETLRGKTLGETRLGNLYPEVDAELAAAVRDRVALKRTLTYQTESGEPVALLLWVVPQEDTQGEIARLWGVLVPI